MNPMKDNVAIMDDIMDYVTQTERWNAILKQDPLLRDAETELNRNLEAPDGLVFDQIEAIRAAAWGLATAITYPAFLYGMQIAQALQEVTANPAALSQYILDRTVKHRKDRT